MDGHAVSPFDLSRTLLVGGSLLVPCSLPVSPVIKQLMQVVYYGAWPGWAVSISVLPLTNSPTMQGTHVVPLGGKDPLEKEMATHSSILAWEIPRTEESGGLQSMGLQRVRHNLVTK